MPRRLPLHLLALVPMLMLTAGVATAQAPRGTITTRQVAWGDGAELIASGDRMGLLLLPAGTGVGTLTAAGLAPVRDLGSGMHLVRADGVGDWTRARAALPGVTFSRYLPSDRPDRWVQAALAAGAAPAFAVDPDGDWRLALRLAQPNSDQPGSDRAAVQALVTGMGGRLLEPDLRYGGMLMVTIPPAAIGALQAADEVVSISFADPPRTTNNTAAQAKHGVNIIQAAPYSLNGSGVNIGVWDKGSAANHCAYTGRVTNVQIVAQDDHSTHVTGTILANDSGPPGIEGMAPAAHSYNYDYNGDVPGEMNSAVGAFGIIGCNNSWGVVIGWEGASFTANRFLFGAYIDSLSGLMDQVAVDNPEFSIVWSAGNDRDDGPAGDKDGTPAPDGERYDLIGPLHGQKNAITVGALYDDNVTPIDFSNFGPTDDSRIKPEIMANGDTLKSTRLTCSTNIFSGTSMAAPVVAGSIADIVQHHRSTHGGTNPRSDLVRALVTNTADELHLTGPDARTGYGRLNARRAVDLLRLDDQPDLQHLQLGTVTAGASFEIMFDVPVGTDELRQMLAWIDPPGSEFAARALINDLDLVLIEPISGTMHHPYRLDAATPHLAATQGVNARDNLEQVVVTEPAPGTWTLRVTGTTVTTPDQDFAIVSNVNLRTAPGYFLLGGAILDCGVPVGGVTVTLDGDLHHVVKTTSSGQYVFQLPAGSYTVTPSSPGAFFGPYQELVSLTGDQLNVDFAYGLSPFPGPDCSYLEGTSFGIPDDDPMGMTYSLNVPDSFNIIDLNVGTLIQHPHRGDLHIELRAPGGSPAVVLRYPNPADAAADFFGRFDSQFASDEDMSVFDGLDSAGTWELFIADMVPGNVGTSFGMTLILTCPSPLPQITTTSLPDATQGVFYSESLMAESGVAPYVWSVVDGALPPGLSLSSTGILDGTCATTGTWDFGVRIVDAGGDCDGRQLSLTVGTGGMPTLSGLCGDCDNNFTRNILDSLLAAQISVGLALPPTGAEPQCNVYNGATTPITVTDALEISRYIVGLTQLVCP